MLALAAQHSPLLASAYANMTGNGLSQGIGGGVAPSGERFRQHRFSPYHHEGRTDLLSNGSAFESVVPRGGGVSPPSHRPPHSPASVCSSSSSFHANNSSNDLLSIENMVKCIDNKSDKSKIRVKNNLSDDQMSDNVRPGSDSQ